MKQFDTNTIEYFGIPSLVLIERAALAAVEELECDIIEKNERILIVAGNGNNGADGLAMARLLHLKKHSVSILYVGDGKKATEENKTELKIVKQYGIPVISKQAFMENHSVIDDATIIIDAIFGVGLSRRIEGEMAQMIDCLNRKEAKKIAIDIPSGIHCDDGSVLGIAFKADLTVTFSFEKLGMRLYPGQKFCGQIRCRNVGIDENSFLVENGISRSPKVAAFETGDLKTYLPKRSPRTNKGSYGKVLVIAGSVNMAGAALFSARSAYRIGCGLVRVLTPEENRVIIQTALPEAVLTTYSSKKFDKEQVHSAINWADVIVCGPGIGTDDNSSTLVRFVLKNTSVPLILDADALNLIAKDIEILRNPHTELILTPHLGEMARLANTTVPFLQDSLVEAAESFAREYQVICVLKDARTVTAVPYQMTYVNLTGNNGMATGGSGDVLTGVIAGLIAQGMAPKVAAPFGVYLHGLAGDVAAQRLGRYSLMAHDMIDSIADVLKIIEK
ncbi:MAG: NAD(P)H-hydrate dehydratase [bacterium]|nr:NAD(P)H-hydrate dehydratase [bacterium]